MPEPILTPMRSAFASVDLEAGIPDRLDAGGHAVMDEGIHAARLLRRQIGGDVEILHLAGDLAVKADGIEAGDRGRCRILPATMLSQASATVLPTGRDDAQPGDDDSATGQGDSVTAGMETNYLTWPLM